MPRSPFMSMTKALSSVASIRSSTACRNRGKGEKIRYVPAGMKALRLITEYLDAAGHKEDLDGALFRPVQNQMSGELNKPLHPVSVYQDIVKRYGREVGITEDVRGFCVHSL